MCNSGGIPTRKRALPRGSSRLPSSTNSSSPGRAKREGTEVTTKTAVPRGGMSLLALTAACAASIALAQDVVYTLVAKDGRFTPSDLTVPAGKRIKIEISNEGATPIEFESRPLKQEKVL